MDYTRIADIADSLFSVTMTSASQMDAMSGTALGRGIDAMTAKNYTAAVRSFRTTISLSPFSDNSLTAFEYMANAYAADGKTEEAIKTLRQGIKVFPSADGLNINLGNLLFSKGDYEGATAEYAAAVKKNPTANQNYYSLGQGYLALKQYEEAATQFKKVIQLLPNDSAGYYALGQTYRMAGRYSEAEDQLEKALSIKRNFPAVNFELGALYAEQKQLNKANEQLTIIEQKELGSQEAAAFYLDLQNRILENSAPKMIGVYSPKLNFKQLPGTLVSSLDASLATPGAQKSFTVNFVFDKKMDTSAVQNITNWKISRSSSYTTGGAYNWGMAVPASEVSVSLLPTNVSFDQDTNTAKVTFTIRQNSAGKGTIDLSHLVFKFMGNDTYGNSMDSAADEYSGISLIV